MVLGGFNSLSCSDLDGFGKFHSPAVSSIVLPLGAVHKVLSVNSSTCDEVGWCVTSPDTVTEFQTTSMTCLVKTSLFPKMLSLLAAARELRQKISPYTLQ